MSTSSKRKQVRVSLDSVLDVSTGERPWRTSFGAANPDVSAGPEPDFGRRACTSYVRDSRRRKIAEGQLQSAQYLHRELPVRLAHAVTALDKVNQSVYMIRETGARERMGWGSRGGCCPGWIVRGRRSVGLPEQEVGFHMKGGVFFLVG